MFFGSEKSSFFIAGPKYFKPKRIFQYFMVVLVTCKNDEGPLKMKALEWSQHFSDCKSLGIFQTLKGAVRGWLLLKYKLIRSFMVVLVTCKNEEDQIKNAGARLVPPLCINFFQIFKGS